MNDDTVNSVTEPSPAEPSGPECGERLAEARLSLQITVLEIAKELRLDEPKVHALERNEFDVLGAPVFVKGHMRKYAQLVGVDSDDVLADYYKLTRSSGMPPVVPARQRIKQELSPFRWIVAIAIILAVLLAYWLINTRGVPAIDVGDDSTYEESQIEAPVEDQSGEIDEPVLLASSDGSDLPATSEAPVDTAVETEEEFPAIVATESELSTGAIDDGQLHLALSFSGECWTEISDADGRRLFFDMGRSERNIELSGKAPFSALFGNVENVSIKVNGSDYTIPARNRRGRTANVTILNP